MEIACLKTLAWLETSGQAPETASEYIENTKANVTDSVQDFLDGAKKLRSSDHRDTELFATRLMMIKGCAQDLCNDVHNIEDALRKTIVSLYEDTLPNSDKAEG